MINNLHINQVFRPRLQSYGCCLTFYRPLTKELNDVAALALFDLSAAFDTVDHSILLQRLQSSYGFDGLALQWFRSYLTGRTQAVRRGSQQSATTSVVCGIPQGSVLGPIMFIMYTPDLVKLIERHGLSPHLFADDTQVYGRCSPGGMSDLAARISACADDILSWMQSNRLQLNADKTDLIWCATSRRVHRLQPTSIRVGSENITIAYSSQSWCIHRLRPVNAVSRTADGRGLLCCTPADTQC